MLNKILTAIFGSQHQRDVKKMMPLVEQINSLEEKYARLTDDQLRGLTAGFRERLAPFAQGVLDARGLDRESEQKQARTALEDELLEILPDAFAICREGSKRSLKMRHYDVQLMGGIVLHRGRIAEMRTGEGKTLVATLAVYLNALAGLGVHVVTVNDYLARRDADWMGKLYRFLGLSVGVIQNSMDDQARQQAYASDVTYGTNNEFGFDYLRDNMKFDPSRMVQRMHNFAIVDEVDSILIDEARTPLIISGPSELSTDKYYKVDKIIPKLDPEVDFQIDEKQQTAILTEEGVAHAEQLLGVENLYDPAEMETLHAVNQGLRAHTLYKRDDEYVVKDGEVIIVDEFTGRLMPGRRWSDGLHQAVEAKEGVKIAAESQTFATITFQNYFRMYSKLSGMTGTADTEAAEFGKIYDLDVSVIPTNMPMIRNDMPDLIYRTEADKFDAIADDIRERHDAGQPVLVGTVSIEKSERLSNLLKRRSVPHVVLNAKQHERESEIVAQAGRKGSVTIATNMAGRGTDIILGGNPEYRAAQQTRDVEDPGERARIEEEIEREWKQEHQEVLDAGGLHIIGTERHESRRIDNQLRGRSGRQGDPGSSRFFLSLEDDLMRIFITDTVAKYMNRGMEDGAPIENRMVTRSIENAQKQVESRNFEIRKHLLEYDDVMNKQRTAIYGLRHSVLTGDEGRAYVLNAAEEILDFLIDTHLPEEERRGAVWNEKELSAELFNYFNFDLESTDVDLESMNTDEIREVFKRAVIEKFEEKETLIGAEMMALHIKFLLLQVLDTQWKDHLLVLDHLKEGIGLRGYGQRDPLVEYKKESFALFQALMERIQDRIVQFIWKADLQGAEAMGPRRVAPPRQENLSYSAPPKEAPAPIRRQGAKIGRNDPCPCGSGKKYKKCHGTAA
ncbi:MAG: preprotein translocase subunit SecA [Acidobacteria bacterium]|nr:preprotein translocase subunit SecA [Acidobacteriota bacterium]